MECSVSFADERLPGHSHFNHVFYSERTDSWGQRPLGYLPSAAHSSKMIGSRSTPALCWFPWLLLRRINGLQREQPLMCWWLPQSRENKHALKEDMWNMWKFERYNGWTAWEWMAGVYIVEFYSGKENSHSFE